MVGSMNIFVMGLFQSWKTKVSSLFNPFPNRITNSVFDRLHVALAS